MPRFVFVCMFVAGSVSQICQAQNTTSPQPAAARKAATKPTTAPRVTITVSNVPSEPDRASTRRRPSKPSRLLRSTSGVVQQRKQRQPQQSIVDAPSTTATADRRPDCPFCPQSTIVKKGRSLLGFTAKWCGPCRQAEPILKRLAKQGYQIQKVDIDSNPKMARQFQVQAVPAFVLIDQGQEVGRVVGRTTERQLKQLFAGGAVDRNKPHPRQAESNTPPAGRVQIVCDRIEFEIDPHTRTQTLRCLGGVTMRSDKFEARAAQVTLRDGKLLFEGKVNFTIKQRTSSRARPNRAIPPASTGVPLQQIRNPPAAPDSTPAEAPSTR